MTARHIWLPIFLAVALAAALSACGGDDDSGGTNTQAASTSATKTAAASQTPLASATDTEDVSGGSDIGLGFNVDGTFKGNTISGAVSPGSLMCNEVGSASSPLVLVLWSGTVDTSGPNKQVSGEVRAEPGTYHAPAGEGTAAITIAGDYQDSPIWTGGSFTINDDRKSGSVDLVFGDAPEQVTVKGTFTCS